MIRKVHISDADQIVKIYNHYIETSTSTFEESIIDANEMQSRIFEISEKKNFPYLVFEDRGQILGYAYAATFRNRIAYRFTVESSVYIHPDHFKKGIGNDLYLELIQEIKNCEFHSIIGVITLPNEASIRLHENFGFRKVGHLTEAGFKFNSWHDVGFWELII